MSILLAIIFSTYSTAQKSGGNKKRMFAYWGWNRGYFTKSDIHFKGSGYDFILKDVIAKDRQSEFSFRTYFHPAKFTIPQTNYGIGYYFHDHYFISLTVDHMKYVVRQNQMVNISGNISGEGLPYQGVYNNDKIILEDSFLKMEHTDGLNYLSLGLARSDNLLKNIKSLENKLEVNAMEGIGIGAMIPKSDVTLLSKKRNDQYRLSGYGLSANVGLQLVLFKHFFIRGEVKAGFVHLTSIKTSPDNSDKAKQHFFFVQPSGQFGWAFYLGQ